MDFTWSAGSTVTPTETTLVFHESFTASSVDQYQYANVYPTAPRWDRSRGASHPSGVGETTGRVQYWGDNVEQNGSGLPDKGDSITTDSNRSGSGAGGGRGFRHWMVYSPSIPTGVNRGGGSGRLDFTGGPYREIWLQWWQRYGVGLTCHNKAAVSDTGNGVWSYVKDLDVNDPGQGRVTIGQSQGGSGSGDWGITTYSPQLSWPPNIASCTWQGQQGGQTGSGVWNKYQVHLKADTGSANGTYEAWFNGTLVAQYTNVNFSGSDAGWTGWSFTSIGNNQSKVGSDTDPTTSYTDYDDFKLSVVGYITQD